MLTFLYCIQQLQASLAPPSADPQGSWNECKLNHAHCNSSQIQFLQGDLIPIFCGYAWNVLKLYTYLHNVSVSFL